MYVIVWPFVSFLSSPWICVVNGHVLTLDCTESGILDIMTSFGFLSSWQIRIICPPLRRRHYTCHWYGQELEVADGIDCSVAVVITALTFQIVNSRTPCTVSVWASQVYNRYIVLSLLRYVWLIMLRLNLIHIFKYMIRYTCIYMYASLSDIYYLIQLFWLQTLIFLSFVFFLLSFCYRSVISFFFFSFYLFVFFISFFLFFLLLLFLIFSCFPLPISLSIICSLARSFIQPYSHSFGHLFILQFIQQISESHSPCVSWQLYGIWLLQ